MSGAQILIVKRLKATFEILNENLVNSKLLVDVSFDKAY